MKSPQRSRQPSSSDDREALLRALGFGARRRGQLAHVVGGVVDPRILIEPRSQVHRGIQVRRVRRQKCDLGTALRASLPQSSSNTFHVTAICRATPTDRAAAAQPSPLTGSGQHAVASHDGSCTKAEFSSKAPGDVRHDRRMGCRAFRKDQ